MRTPGPLSLPSKGFDGIELPIVTVDGHWFRTHHVERAPIHYGSSAKYRFDDPEGKYGVLYLAQQPAGAFIETFGQFVTTVECPRRITSQELAGRALCELVANRPLRLADLTGNGLARIGADARIFAGDTKKRSTGPRHFTTIHPASMVCSIQAVTTPSNSPPLSSIKGWLGRSFRDPTGYPSG